MLYVTVERTVPRRPEIVWEVLSDVAALPAWIEGLVEAELSGDRLEVGARIQVVRQSGRQRAAATCEITALKPPHLLVVETRLSDVLMLDRVTLAPSAEGTTLEVRSELMLGSRLTEFFALPRVLGSGSALPELEAIYERSVDALIKRIETTSAVPYR